MIGTERTGKSRAAVCRGMLCVMLSLFLISCQNSGGARLDETEEIEAEEIETEEVKAALTAAPPLWLRDTLASTLEEYEVASGNYSWNYKEEDQMASVIACGVHPLEEGKVKTPITLPKYNQMDSVPCQVSCIWRPARIRVDEYSSDDLGRTQAEMLSSELYEESLILPLKPDRVYELTAEWDPADLEKNGCYGSASYVIVTE